MSELIVRYGAGVVRDYAETDRVVLHLMRTVDLGEPTTQSEPLTPGENDPNHRTSAFVYAVSRVLEPLVEIYTGTEPEDLNVLLPRTFRLSFHYSAGSPLIQSMIQLRTAHHMQRKYGSAALEERAQALPFDAKQIVPPPRHVDGRSMLRAEQRGQAIWDFYMDILRHVEDPGLVEPRDKMRAIDIRNLNTFGNEHFGCLGLPYFMLLRELDYLENGRPQRQTAESSYRSFIREHAFAGKPAPTAELTLLFTEMGITLSALGAIPDEAVPDLYLVTGVRDRFASLRAAWEDRHQQSFLPASG